MKIGVIADTHIPVSAKKLPQKVYDHFKDCDLIIHAGDAVELSVIRDLKTLAKVKAVRGNMDSDELKRVLPEKIVFTAAGKRIGVMHGRGPGFKVVQFVEKAFGEKPDIVVFGHSHKPLNKKKGGTLFFNPGSATDLVFAPYRSFGIIEIDGNDIRSEIIKIED